MYGERRRGAAHRVIAVAPVWSERRDLFACSSAAGARRARPRRPVFRGHQVVHAPDVCPAQKRVPATVITTAPTVSSVASRVRSPARRDLIGEGIQLFGRSASRRQTRHGERKDVRAHGNAAAANLNAYLYHWRGWLTRVGLPEGRCQARRRAPGANHGEAISSAFCSPRRGSRQHLLDVV